MVDSPMKSSQWGFFGKTKPDDNGEYDARVISESFYDVLTGKVWPIEFTNRKDYEERSKQNTSQIAVLGYENMGKSFLLSKIMDRQLPQGKHTKTKGLCVLYPKDKLHPWTALDTPGTNISVKAEKVKNELQGYFQTKKIEKNEIMRMLFGDNILMEALLQEFVILHAQVILVVVSKLRRDDQRLIARIKSLPGKRVLIVHNLYDSTKIDNVRDIIREDIFGTFKVREKQIQSNSNKENNIIYIEEEEDSKIRGIEHIVIAQEKSTAGKFYNKTAIEYIRKVIDGCNHSEPFDLVDSFTKYINKNLRKYLSGSESVTPDGDNFIVAKNEADIPWSIRLKNFMQFDLKLSLITEIGDVRTYSKDGLENVPFTVRREREVSYSGTFEDFLVIEYENVGDYSTEEIGFKVFEEKNESFRIMMFGKSRDNHKAGTEYETIEENTRKFGDFTIETKSISIPGYTIFRAERPFISQRKPGLVSVAFRLYEKVIS